MLIIEAAAMVIHKEINCRKREQSLAKVQKTISLYYFALVSKLLAGNGKKVWWFVVYAWPPCH